MTTIVLAEDHQLVREGLKAILEKEPHFKLVGEAPDGLAAIELVEKRKPDILLLDLMIPRLHGLDVIRRVAKLGHTRTIVLTMHADEPYVAEALKSGAQGYVLKDESYADLVAAIHKVQSGKVYLSPVLDLTLVHEFSKIPSAKNDSFQNLTPRELVIFQLAAEGLTSVEVARRLFISPRTAETHRANMMRKLHLRSQTDLVRLAIRKKMLAA